MRRAIAIRAVAVVAVLVAAPALAEFEPDRSNLGAAPWAAAPWEVGVANPTFELPWPLGADLNGDWSLDAADVLELVLSLGECDEPCPADLDGDGSVDAMDLLLLMAEINPPPLLAKAGPAPGPGESLGVLPRD